MKDYLQYWLNTTKKFKGLMIKKAERDHVGLEENFIQGY